MAKIPVISQHISEKRHGISFKVLNWDVLRDQTRKRVNDGAITDFLIVLGVSLVPLVGVDLAESLHKQLRPQLHQVARPRQDRHPTEITGNAVIDLDQTLLAHKSQLDPVFAAWGDDRHVILLRVDALPDQLVRVDVTDVAILGKLEL